MNTATQRGDIAGLEARLDAAGFGTLHRDICPCRDDAQPHIVKNGECVLCFKKVTP